MDYRKFLKSAAGSAVDTLVLPYFGGTRVDAAARWYHVADPAPPVGWATFRIDRREATYVAPADPVDLSALPALRGHYVHGWVIADGRTRGRIALPIGSPHSPAGWVGDEPTPLSKVTLRRWHSGEYLFDGVDFEDDAETAARAALERRDSLGDVRGASPSLRIAFGLALGMEAARGLEIPMTVTELNPIAIMIAEGGVDVVRQLFDDLVEERRMAIERARLAAEVIREQQRLAGIVGSVRVKDRATDPRRRADEVLSAARARLLSVRTIANGRQLDVVYDVDGNRIMSIIDVESFQVIDPGVCLAGAHRVLTLDAMPSVVREAIEENHLNITRRS